MKNIFLFTGEETYLLNEQIKSWKKAFVEKHGDLNLEVLEATQVPLNEMMASLTAMPFLGDKRLIFVHGLPDAPKARQADKITKKDEKREEDLKKFEADLKDIPETSVVVFIQPNPDKRKSFYKNLLKQVEVKEFSLLAGSTLIQWVQNRIRFKGAQVSSSVAEYLVSLTGQNLWHLSTEIDKLTSHSPGANLSKELIDELVVPTIEANVFQLTDALSSKNRTKAMLCLQRTMTAGDNLQPAFYMIVRQFRLLLQGRSFSDKEVAPSPATFAARLKLHPFVARNTLAQVKRFKAEELKRAYKNLLEIDTGLKTSRIKVLTDDQTELALAIERFILDLCR